MSMVDDLARGIATGAPVAIAIGLVVAYRVFKSDREYRSLAKKAGKDGYTELMCAAWASDVKSVRQALNDGADVNTQDQEGMTALMHACVRADRVDVLKELIAAGANPSTRRVSGGRAIDIAYNLKHTKQVAFLNQYSDEN